MEKAIMMSGDVPFEEGIERFFNAVYGYGKLAEILREMERTGRNVDKRLLKQYLQGTMLGTFKHHETESPDWSSPLAVPEIIPIDRALEQERPAKRKDLQYHISGHMFFHKYTGEEVKTFLADSVKPLFPGSVMKGEVRKVFENSTENWIHALNSRHLLICVRGKDDRPAETIIDMNAPDYLAGYLNKIRTDYYTAFNISNKP